MENKKVLIYAELKNGKVESSAYEFLTKARDLFPGKDMQMAFVVLGKGIDAAVAELKESGIDTVYAMDNAKLANFNNEYYTLGVMEAVDAFDPDILLVPASSFGEELGPTVAKRYMTAGSAHCVDLTLREDGTFVMMVPAFGGKVIGEIMVPDTRPQIASVKPGNFTAVKQESRNANVVELSSAKVDAFTSAIEFVSEEVVKVEGVPVEKADLVIAGGYGVGGQDAWNNIEALANKIANASYACTRPVVDEGWVKDEKHMVGTSGKTIRPKVYIGTGISGATHHLCGMKDAGVIITINSDADAEIFKASNYKAVCDGNKVIEELVKIVGK